MVAFAAAQQWHLPPVFVTNGTGWRVVEKARRPVGLASPSPFDLQPEQLAEEAGGMPAKASAAMRSQRCVLPRDFVSPSLLFFYQATRGLENGDQACRFSAATRTITTTLDTAPHLQPAEDISAGAPPPAPVVARHSGTAHKARLRSRRGTDRQRHRYPATPAAD
jgi:hypothetical protein